MQFNALLNKLLNESSASKIIPKFTGTRSGYEVTTVMWDERLDDIYEGGRYPAVYFEKIERSFLEWKRFDVAARNGPGIVVHYIGYNFQQARQELMSLQYLKDLEAAPEVKPFKKLMLQEVDRLSEVQGKFIVYKDITPLQPYVTFAVEIDQGYYRGQYINQGLQDVDTTGFEDLL